MIGNRQFVRTFKNLRSKELIPLREQNEMAEKEFWFGKFLHRLNLI
jgi:hypothetical protein